MATQTVKFACQELPATCPVRLISGGSPVAADSISEVYEGLMQATYSNLAGDYTLHPLTAGGDPLGVGTVYNVTNTAATFMETSLLEPSSGGSGDCPTASEVAAEVVTQLAGENIAIIDPFPRGGVIRTLQGSAYKLALGNRKQWADVNAVWPALTSATIVVRIDQGTADRLEFSGTVITATGSKVVGLELEMADTTSIAVSSTAGAWKYWVIATIGSDEFELATGAWVSDAQPATPTP